VKYRVFEKFSPEARRAAATATYDARDNEDHRRTADGCCPLGVALNHDRVRHPYGMSRWIAPMPALLSRATR
jgi:hypothetical protein